MTAPQTRSASRVWLAIGLLVVSCTGSGSAPQSTINSMFRARQVLDASLDAIGPKSARDTLYTIVRAQEFRRISEAQGRTPASAGDIPGERVSLIDLRGQRVSETRYLQITGGQPWGIRTLVTPTGAYFIELSNGTYRELSGSRDAARAAVLRRSPESLLLAAATHPQDLRWVGTMTRGGKLCDVILLADADAVLVTLFVDRKTHLLEATEFLYDDPFLGDRTLAVEFADYRQVGELHLPFRTVEHGPGVDRWENRVTSLTLNTQLSDSIFELPAGLSPATEPALGSVGPMQLSENVYAVPGPSASLAVLFRDYALIVEAPQNSRRSEAVIAWVKGLAPTKPIRYLVATHFHHDHIGGVRPYIALGTIILTTADAKPLIEAAARATHSMRPDRLSANPVAPRIETVDSQWTIDDGSETMVLRQIGPNPHVDQMLVAYLPRRQIIFESDLLSTIWGQPVPGGEAASDLEQKLAQRQWPVKWIVAGHGGVPASIDVLRHALTIPPRPELCRSSPLRSWGACRRRPEDSTRAP